MLMITSSMTLSAFRPYLAKRLLHYSHRFYLLAKRLLRSSLPCILIIVMWGVPGEKAFAQSVSEVEPNNTPGTGQSVDLPIRINGLSSPGANVQDWYTFYDNMSGTFEYVGISVIGASAIVEFCEFDDAGRTLNQSCDTLTPSQTISMVKSKFYSSRITTAGPGASSYDVVFAVTNLDTTSAVAPVEWLSFKAALRQNQTLLSWSTASEENNQGFYLERSPDTEFWEEIGFVAGAGTTQEVQYYTFTDPQPAIGYNYYRIRQTDYNGDTDYSSIQAIVLDPGLSSDLVRVYPNPVVDLLTVSPFIGTLTVRDLTGRILLTQKMNGSTTQLAFNRLTQGLYLLEIAPHNAQPKVVRVVKR